MVMGLMSCHITAYCYLCRAICRHLLQQSICSSSGLLPSVLVGGEKHQAASLCALQRHAGKNIMQQAYHPC